MIKQIDPYNIEKLKSTYEELVSSCWSGDTSHLNFDDFIACSNSIYVYKHARPISFKKDEVLLRSTDFAIIGCARMLASSLGFSDLPYHCTENDVVYEIKFLHSNLDTSIPSAPFSASTIKYLIETCLHDKNDAFCIMKESNCDNMEAFTNQGIDCLKATGFEPYTDKYNGKQYFIRKPKTR